jgi:hypothetical protein
MGAWRNADACGRVARFLEPYRGRLASVRVDAIAIGFNFGLRLREKGFPVELINVSHACESKPHLRERDPARRFVNEKACFYQELADVIERDQIEGLIDETTIGQLAGILYEIDSHGRMQIESKAIARKRGVRSPDRAEALMLALCKPPPKYEYFSARDRRRLQSTSAGTLERDHPFWGFTEVPDDDEDFTFKRSRSRYDCL